MATQSHTEMIVLALLRDGPAHAYELIQRIEAMRLNQWARVRESTLYNTLHRMQARGWVKGSRQPGERGRERVVYEGTAKGHSHLAALVKKGLAEPAPIYSDELVAGVVSASMKRPELIDEGLAQLEVRRKQLVEARAQADLSGFGETILDFYAGIMDLHRQALLSLKSHAARRDETG